MVSTDSWPDEARHWFPCYDLPDDRFTVDGWVDALAIPVRVDAYLAVDRTQSDNVAAENRDKLIEMIAQWYVEAGKYNVLPVDGRGTARFAEERPQIAKDRTSYTFYPHTQAVPFNAGPRLLNRTHTITADLEIPDGGAEGVLVSFGGAGGLHVCALAEALGIRQALVPVHAGVLSALGMLAAPRGRQLLHSVPGLIEEQTDAQLTSRLQSLAAPGRAVQKPRQRRLVLGG